MSNSSKNNGFSQESMPQITTFQFSNDAVGQIKDSVNLFTGTANIPINIASLPGRKGLDVNIGIMYSSNVKAAVQNWNLTHPTGITGLGWDMSFDRIIVNKAGSGTPTSDSYFLLSNGSGNMLVQDGFIPASPANVLTFQTRNYEFWNIKYDPAAEKWTIIKEDGTIFVYGDKNSGRNTLQYGVSFGNWMGSSSLTNGQEQYVTSWNLSEIQNVWGEKVSYEYDNVQFKVGSGSGLEYTQASYLKKITDSYNRTIIFNYGEKYGARNPGSNNVIEYQAAHTQQPSPNGYQEQYETRFLDSIDIFNPLGTKQFSILFEYDFVNIGSQSQQSVYPLMYKRVLTSFWQVQPGGKTLPGMEFEYYKLSTDINPGALKAVTYPQGAKAIYTYKQQPLSTSRNMKISSPMAGAVPRVWFGSDYTVVTWYNAATKTLRGSVYSWCGNWITFELNSDVTSGNYFNGVDFDINTLGVITRPDFIALYFVEKTLKQLQLFIYRRNPEKFGVFNLSQGPKYLPVKSATPSIGVDAGDTFIIAFGKDFTNNPVTAYQWNWKQNRWDTTPASNPPQGSITVQMPSATDISNATYMAIAARKNYYISALYNNTSKVLQFQLFYHDGLYTWGKSPLYSTTNVSIYQDPQNTAAFMLNLALSDAFAAVTYISNITSANVDYSIRILQWDKAFNLLNPTAPLVNNYKSPVNNEKAQFNAFNTLMTDALISNNPYLNRYTGGVAGSNNPLNWKQAVFTTGPGDVVNFATGEDISVLSDNKGTTAVNQYLQFNPDNNTWGTAQRIPSSGTYPTISGNYMTVGQDVFYQNSAGQWIKQGALANLQAPQTVQNRGAAYIAYQDNTSASANTFFTAPMNSLPGAPVKLPLTAGGPGQKIWVDQDQVKAGTLLSGADTFVAYPSDQDFNAASSLALYKVADGKATENITVTPVSYMEIDDLLYSEENYYQSYDYASSAQSIITFDAVNSLAQFPKVTVVTGSKVPNAAAAPNGISINYFSNGVSKQGEIPYPGNWVYNYNLLLNGALLQKTLYNSAGQMVESETNYWALFKTNIVAMNFYYGAYYRLSKNVTVKDGVTQTTELQYYQDIGLQQLSTTSYYNSSGELKTISGQNVYAIQVDNYRQAMEQKHLLNAIAQETSWVTDVQGTKKYTGSKVVTWKNWSADGDWKWAAFQNYQWLGPADGEPVFDFTAGAARGGWLKKQEVVSRELPYEVITELADVSGIHSSYIYDNCGRFQVAEFPTASAAGGEISYYGFEPYENPDGWQTGTNAGIIPGDSDAVIDAEIGISSLKFTSGTGIQRQFTPRNQKQDYVFSSYVKLPQGFDSAKGTAKWIISFTKSGGSAGLDLVLPFGDITGSWQYVYGIISLAGMNPDGIDSLVSIDIKAQNDNTDSAVLVDCLRFSPLQSLFAAVSLDVNTSMVNAALGANGEVRRKFFDDFERVAATTGFSGATTSIAATYFSRTGNDNQFSVSDPNSKLRIMAADGGPALPFTQGNQWEQYWSAGQGSVWTTVAGKLQLKSFQTEGELTYKGDMGSRFGVFTRLAPAGSLSRPLGIRIGEQFTIQWVPSAGNWQLLDESGNLLQEKTLYSFELENSVSGEGGSLRAAMQARLLRRGFYISPATDTDAGYLYDSSNNHFFAVSSENNVTRVSGMGNQWLLIVNETSLFYYVDGQQVFNYVNSRPITGAATIFAGDAVVLDYLLASFSNQVTCTFVNETGNDFQSQLLFDDYVNVVENVYNDLGRIIANTKPAFVHSSENPLLKYFPGFATYDFANGSMSGYISEFYPDDAGYPYFGTKFEASPLGRVIEKSMPGADFKMGAHTQKTSYGANDDRLGLPANQFYQTTVIDQNGNMSYSLQDKQGQEVRKVSQKNTSEQIVAAAYYDDAGNTVELRSPNYLQGGENGNWTTLLAYNFIGQLISATSNTMGSEQMIYDSANRLRFRQDAQAAADGNYQYFKYDDVGRTIETGYINGTWDRQQLQNKADSNPDYPSTPPTWTSQTFYDYDGTNLPNQIGRPVRVLNSQSNQGVADVEESFAYDVFGNVLHRGQKVTPFDQNNYITGFSYNNLSGITRIDYPLQHSGTQYSVFYQYDNAGQITGISDNAAQPGNIACYVYNPAGKPEQETINPGNGNVVTRNYTYNAPLWLTQIHDENSHSEQLFKELLKTSAAETGGPSYFNGQPAEISFSYPSDIPAGSIFTNWYNGINALVKADETANSGNPVSSVYDFDDNGNFDSVTIGMDAYNYNKVPQKGDQLQSIQINDQTVLEFNYYLNGSVKNYHEAAVDGHPERNLRFDYNAGNGMTSEITDSVSGLTSGFYYSNDRIRVLKNTLTGSGTQTSTLYINSLSGKTLSMIQRQGGSDVTTNIIYGPTGIAAFVRDNSRYSVLKDHLGSVRLIIDENADVAAAYNYDLYGNTSTLLEPSANFFCYLFSSQELDAELGIYNFNARFYFSRAGRFGAVDSSNQFYSPYLYAGNNPLVYIDPSGNFSIGNFFSAIGGAIIGAFEILIGVAIDAIAGVLEVITGGLSTPASVGLAMLSGAFIGSGVSAVSYSAVGLITNDFSWKDYGINTAIGFVAGAITGGFGAAGSIAAEAATGVKAAAEAGEAVSTLAKVANAGIKTGFAVAGAETAAVTGTVIGDAARGQDLTTGLSQALITGAISTTISSIIPPVAYKAGWGALLTRMAANIAKSEAIGVTIQLGSNAIQGNSLNTGILNTVVGGVVKGSVGAFGTRDYAKDETKKAANFMNLGAPKYNVPADGIIRL